MSEICVLCYETELRGKTLFYNCECSFKCCDDCFTEWVAQYFKTNILNENIRLKCPNQLCEKDYSFEELRQMFLNHHK